MEQNIKVPATPTAKMHVEDFVKTCIGNYGILYFTVTINDEPEPGINDWNVIIKNSTNDRVSESVIRTDDDAEGFFRLLKGDEFYETDHHDFLVCLFIDQFVTFTEV